MRFRSSKRSFVLALSVAAVCLLAAPTAAQDNAQQKPCSGDKYRLFDFWVGDWDVFDTDGTKVGRNRIESILGGCALQENWTGNGGSIGHSFNIYDAANDKWHQTWVDNRGLLLELDGGFSDGRMMLEGKRPGPDGKLVHHRITWKATPEGHVHQRWNTSSDGGGTWNTIFDGVYKKRS